MLRSTSHDQTILEFAQGGFIPLAVNSFLIDRQAAGLSPNTIRFYRQFLGAFEAYCDAQAMQLIQDINADFLRRYLLAFAENHNPGGVHAMFRTMRTFFRWLENEEALPPEWKNPIRKVKPPKVPVEHLDPVSIEDILALIDCCKRGEHVERDKAIFLFLLDTGLRARELCNIDLADLDLNTGAVIVRQGKGRKPRQVYLGRKTRRAVRAYLRSRQDNSPALFISKFGEKLTYDGLRQILRRRAANAGLKPEPTLHSFRRAFALNFLRNGGDIFTLQRLMGHSDLSVLRRYLAQTDQDIQTAHSRHSPVDNNL